LGVSQKWWWWWWWYVFLCLKLTEGPNCEPGSENWQKNRIMLSTFIVGNHLVAMNRPQEGEEEREVVMVRKRVYTATQLEQQKHHHQVKSAEDKEDQ
jgi:hypothetical protein